MPLLIENGAYQQAGEIKYVIHALSKLMCSFLPLFVIGVRLIMLHTIVLSGKLCITQRPRTIMLAFTSMYPIMAGQMTQGRKRPMTPLTDMFAARHPVIARHAMRLGGCTFVHGSVYRRHNIFGRSRRRTAGKWQVRGRGIAFIVH